MVNLKYIRFHQKNKMGKKNNSNDYPYYYHHISIY